MARMRSMGIFVIFFFSSRRRHTRYWRDWSSDVCSSDLCGSETQTGSHGDGKQVERVRDHFEDDLFSSFDLASEPELRKQEADTKAEHAQEDACHQAGYQEPEEKKHDRARGDANQNLHAHPIGDPQVARIAGHGETLFGNVRGGCAAKPSPHSR